jgi:Mrp family chromosome partitioning ATPase
LVDLDGRNARSYAVSAQAENIVQWWDETKDFNQLQLAVQAGMPGPIQWLLTFGGLDPRRFNPATPSPKALAEQIRSRVLASGVEDGADATATAMHAAQTARLTAATMVILDSLKLWSPRRHWLFPLENHASLTTMLLAANRLMPTAAPMRLSKVAVLPTELWHFIGGFVMART